MQQRHHPPVNGARGCAVRQRDRALAGAGMQSRRCAWPMAWPG